MVEQLQTSLPQVKEPDLYQKVRQSRLWISGGEWNNFQLHKAKKIIEAAQDVFAKVCAEQDKTGAMLGISTRERGAAILFIQIGEITAEDPEYVGGKKSKYVDFVEAKIEFLQENPYPHITRSSENQKSDNDFLKTTNMTKKEVPGGAVAFGNMVIGISGLSSNPKIDEAAVYAIAKRINLYDGWNIDNLKD